MKHVTSTTYNAADGTLYPVFAIRRCEWHGNGTGRTNGFYDDLRHDGALQMFEF